MTAVRIAVTYIKTFLAAVVTLVVGGLFIAPLCNLLQVNLSNYRIGLPWFRAVMFCAVMAVLMAVVYAGMLIVLRCQEFIAMVRNVVRRFRRTPWLPRRVPMPLRSLRTRLLMQMMQVTAVQTRMTTTRPIMPIMHPPTKWPGNQQRRRTACRRNRRNPVPGPHPQAMSRPPPYPPPKHHKQLLTQP